MAAPECEEFPPSQIDVIQKRAVVFFQQALRSRPPLSKSLTNEIPKNFKIEQ
jgi:hypothetical protein